MPIFATAPVRIQPYFGYRSATRLRIVARALRARQPSFDTGGTLRAMRLMLAQFLSHEKPGLPVSLEICAADGTRETHEAMTDAEGYVHFDIQLGGEGWALPGRTEWQSVVFRWENRHGSQSVEGHVLVPGADVTKAVISDVDDTIIETGITGGVRQFLRNARRVLAQLPKDRIAVPGADAFYTALGGGLAAEEAASVSAPGKHIAAPHRPFFYVSSSPYNLYSYLVAFMRLRGFPLGPLMLRDWGFDRRTFGKSSHGTHKRAAIDAIVEIYPDLRFALIGDDTQADLIAYGGVAEDYPDRIAAIFIRKAGEALSAEEQAAQEAIRTAGIPLWMGDSYAVEADFLQSAGLAGEKDVEDIVEKTGKAAEVDKAASA